MNTEQALTALRYANERRKNADKDYETAIVDCVEAGLTNRKMGEAAGVTEAAIRMYRNRRGI